jgi:hypothetical protein
MPTKCTKVTALVRLAEIREETSSEKIRMMMEMEPRADDIVVVVVVVVVPHSPSQCPLPEMILLFEAEKSHLAGSLCCLYMNMNMNTILVLGLMSLLRQLDY